MIGPTLLLAVTATPQTSTGAVTQAMCQIGEATPAACRITDTATRNGRHRMTFQIGGTMVRFDGSRQSGWWSGRLNGRPAMGFERNRGYTVFSTADLKTRFAWWSPGSEHGSY